MDHIFCQRRYFKLLVIRETLFPDIKGLLMIVLVLSTVHNVKERWAFMS